jgi:hypothetical protein
MAFNRNPKDFLSGLLFIGFGVAALVISKSYNVGTAAKMGPGYFPHVIGILMIALGALLSILSFRSASNDKITWRWRPLAIVLLAVCFFPWVADYLGLILTSVVMVFIASAASQEFRWKEALVSGLILGFAVTAVFVYGLALPLPVLPAVVNGGM